MVRPLRFSRFDDLWLTRSALPPDGALAETFTPVTSQGCETSSTTSACLGFEERTGDCGRGEVWL